ncbi:hypothetical protein ABI_37090 [Asticcacaulis biprosthecium C19]|uniref:Uncharacterized protein n=1 Tax=Asticcacaulis biprosthecium C19 TaxID=715226 RepID=F4QR41_9CAUL|nr:hypothetical protein ABI_37090 [Asticcacaulis biprosthecium C19]
MAGRLGRWNLTTESPETPLRGDTERHRIQDDLSRRRRGIAVLIGTANER